LIEKLIDGELSLAFATRNIQFQFGGKIVDLSTGVNAIKPF
jgi:hypothetical protein